MRCYTAIFYSTFFLLLGVSSIYGKESSSFRFNEANTKAYNELLKLKLTTGKMLLVESKEKIDGANVNGITTYLENCHDIIQLLITEDQALYEQFEERAERRLEQLESLDKASPYYLFIQAELQMQWAMVKLKFGKRLAAINDGLDAYRLLKKNSELFPDFIPNKKTLGACKVLFGSLPKQSRKWVGLLGLKGNVQEGMRDLDEVINSNTVFALEAKVVKGFLAAYILGEHEQSLHLFQQLAKTYPDNQLFYFATAIAAKHSGNAPLALAMLENAPKGDLYCDFYFLDYLKAEACLLTGEYYKSIMYAKSFLQRFKGENYVKDAYFKLFLANWFIDNPKADMYLAKVRELGDDLVIPDQYAKKFADAGYLPNKTITRARLLHDGGNYEKALNLLKEIDPNSLSELRNQIEYYYRTARAVHQMKDVNQAIQIYKQVIAICPKDFPHYYGGNAALQLGSLYLDYKGDKATASYYFNQVFTYEGHEYEGSLNNRAKALLAMIDQ